MSFATLRLLRHTAAWSITFNIGARVGGDFNELDHGTANMTDDGGGLISQWKDQKTGLALNATGAARPTWVAGKGVFFNAAHYMASTGVGSLPTGANGGSIWWTGTQLALDGNPRNLVSYGSSPQQRTVRVNYVTHRPGAITTAVVMEDDSKNFLARSVIQGKFLNGMIYLRYNGQACGSIAATLSTGTSFLRFGADMAGTPARFAIGYYNRALFIAGDTTEDEEMRIEAELLGADAYDILPAGHPYRPLAAVQTLAENLIELDDTMTAAALGTTPETAADMSPAPTITPTTSAPAGQPIEVRYTTTPQLLRFSGGFELPNVNYRQAPAGLLGYIDVDDVPTLFNVTSSFAMEFETNAPKVVFRVFGSDDFPYRVFIDGQYADRAGTFTSGSSGTNYISYDLGGAQTWRTWTMEINRSNLIDGIRVGATDLVRPVSRTPKIKNWLFLGDSMTHGLIEGYHWDGYAPRAARLMGMRQWMANGVDGTGIVYRPFDTAFNLADRFNDVSDADMTLRQTLGILGRADADGLAIMFGVNEIASGVGATGITAALQIFLPAFHYLKPHVPVVVFGPFDRLAPLPVEPLFDEVEAAIEDGCVGQPNVIFKSLRGMEYGKRVDDTVHASLAGAGTIAARVRDDCHDAVATLRALYA